MANNFNEIDGIPIDWDEFRVQSIWHYLRAIVLAFQERLKALDAFYGKNTYMWLNIGWINAFFYAKKSEMNGKTILSFCNMLDDAFWRHYSSLVKLTLGSTSYCWINTQMPFKEIDGEPYINTLTETELLSLIGQTSWISAYAEAIRCNDLSWMPNWFLQYKKALQFLLWIRTDYPRAFSCNALSVLRYYKSITSEISWAQCLADFAAASWTPSSNYEVVVEASWWEPSVWRYYARKMQYISNFAYTGLKADIEYWYSAHDEPIAHFGAIDSVTEPKTFFRVFHTENVDSFNFNVFEDDDFNVFSIDLDPATLPDVKIIRNVRENAHLKIGIFVKFDIPNGFKFR